MNWFSDYNSVHSLPLKGIMFLRRFNSVQDFHTYCSFNLPEDYFLINDKITFEKVLRDLENVQKESDVSNV